MHYDFDEVIDRVGSGSDKWDTREQRFGHADLLPLWVADMDFRSPPPVVEALMRRAEHGIYGYATRPDAYFEAIVAWLGTRHAWRIQSEWIAHSPGVVAAIDMIVQTLTQPGDRILIQSPVYHPFERVTEAEGRVVLNSPLRLSGGRYEMDFADLDRKLADASLMILCSPHNPVGRVWTKDELARLGELCVKYGVPVISDEIHGDLVYGETPHTPFAALGSALADLSITCVAPSKTFNLAGLYTSCVVIPNAGYRERYQQTLRRLSIGGANPFGVTALIAAYREGAPWLDQLLAYLRGNADLIESFIRERLPEIGFVRPEGTYLAWLDCRSLGLSEDELDHLFRREARVGLDEGRRFGLGGEGHMRLNFGCPRSVLREGLTRVERAVAGRRS